MVLIMNVDIRVQGVDFDEGFINFSDIYRNREADLVTPCIRPDQGDYVAVFEYFHRKTFVDLDDLKVVRSIDLRLGVM